jgi:hypothetical protein
VWRSLGANLRLHKGAGSLRAPRAALLALLVVLTFPPARGHAVSRDATEQSQTSDAGQSGYDAGQSGYDAGQAAYAAGRFIDALRMWRPLADRGDPRAAFSMTLGKELGKTRRLPMFGTGVLPRRDLFSPSSTSQ